MVYHIPLYVYRETSIGRYKPLCDTYNHFKILEIKIMPRLLKMDMEFLFGVMKISVTR